VGNGVGQASVLDDDAPPAAHAHAHARALPTAVALALAATSFSVFLLEIALLRAVAQVTWPPLSFVALSAAMLGGGVAGTALSLRPALLRRPAAAIVGVAAVALGGPLAMATALLAGIEPLAAGQDATAAVTFIGALALLSLPFVGLTVLLSASIVAWPGHAQRLYAADLLGGAAGAACARRGRSRAAAAKRRPRRDLR
jgi:hypothetical protein